MKVGQNDKLFFVGDVKTEMNGANSDTFEQQISHPSQRIEVVRIDCTRRKSDYFG